MFLMALAKIFSDFNTRKDKQGQFFASPAGHQLGRTGGECFSSFYGLGLISFCRSITHPR